jgi:hypothetical protein
MHGKETNAMSKQAEGNVSHPPSVVSEKRPRSSIDDIIDLYKKDVDRSLLRANLKLSVTDRILKFQEFGRFATELHESGRRHRGELGDG